MLNKLGKFLGGGVSKPIRDIAGAFIAPKDTRVLNEHEYKLAVLKQFEAYTTSEKGSLFERFVGGLNALPRPLMALGSIALVAWIILAPSFGADTEKLFAGIIALQNAPFVTGLLGTIVMFYFGSRIQVKSLNAKQTALRIENMEKTSNLVMDMIDRLDKREDDKSDHSLLNK